jgi:predicted Zn-dependent protease
MSESAFVQLERLLEVGRLPEARQLLGELLGQAPGDPDLCVYAARVALADDDLEEGRRQLEAALGRDPEHFAARYLLFHVELHVQHYTEAEEIITRLIREDPEDPDLLNQYAGLMLTTLHLDKARVLADEALRLDPSHRGARLTDVVLSTVEGRRDRAGARLSDLVHDDPEAHDVAYGLLVSLAEQGQNEDALRLCQELMRSEPDNEGLIETAVALRAATHWLALPLRPMQRFGWGASAAIWIVAIIAFRFLDGAKSTWMLTALGIYLTWVLYTWIYMPLMTRWLRARGL